MKKWKIKPNFGSAWVLLSLCFALHVIDEALNNFLTFYNPMALAIRQRTGFIPLPTFTFEIWLSGLILAVIILLSLSSWAFRERKWIILFSYFYGVIMVANELIHFAGSIYMSKAIPGVYSSPFLLMAAIYLLWSARNSQRSPCEVKSQH